MPKEGLVDYAWQRAFGDRVSFVTLEFGTYPFRSMLEALRAASTARPGTPPPALIYLGVAVFAFNTVASLGYLLPLVGAILGPALDAPPDAHKRVRASAWIVAPLAILALLVIAIGVGRRLISIVVRAGPPCGK